MARRGRSPRTPLALALIALVLSCCNLAELVKAQLVSPSNTANDNAQTVANQLVAAFGGTPEALAGLRQQASYVLQMLGDSSPPTTAASGPAQIPSMPQASALTGGPAAATPAVAPPAAQPAISAPSSGSSSGSSGLTPTQAAALQAALDKLNSAWLPPVSAASQSTSQVAPSASSGPSGAPLGLGLFGLLPAAAPVSPVPSLADAFTTLASSGLAASMLQGATGMSAQPTIGNSSTPRVQAASGYLDPTLANAFAPIGSGDNLLEFRKRVQAVKEWYREARTYLHIDDAIRIQGYLNTLESLGIAFIAAFPIAELAFFIANVALAASITSLLGGIFYTAASAVSLTGSIIGLQAALDAAAAARQQQAAAASAAAASAADAAAAASADAGARAAAPSTLVGSSSSASSTSSSATTDVTAGSTLSTLINNKDLVNNLVGASQGLSDQLLPWVLGGGAAAPMSLATDILGAASDSLNRLTAWQPPANIMAGFSNIAGSTSTGPLGGRK